MLNELKKIKNFVKQNPNQEGQDYIEQDKRIGLFNAITGLRFNSIISTEPVYIFYAKFFDIQDLNKELQKEESQVAENNKLNSKKVLLFPDTRQAKKNIPSSLIDKLENEIAAKGFTLEIAYFKQVPDIATTFNDKSASNSNKVVYANFKTLIQLIRDAELILGADSLPIHLAYLLKKPHYILYPNGYPQLFMTPYAQINNRFGTFDHYNFSFL
jgi:ADP-heptose:LPS heptosyltransferase